MRAVGVEPAPAAKAARKKGAGKPPRATRAGSKQARLIEMLKRPKGASIEEIVKAFGWQPHTVRGAIAGALKKKLGLDVTSEKVEGRGRVYAIRAEG
jgi:predicted ArsR family transcriptional regulator